MSSLLQSALKYATSYGWAVFPVSQETKKPLTPHGCKDAKTDPGAIRSWWTKYPTASIGIATGKKSNLIVIDEDIDEDKGLNGYQEVRKWESIHGELPETITATTGRGGSHLYFRYDKDDIGNRTGILEGVDVRGEGGYVIAPPSIHPNGTEYTWEFPPNEYELAPLDDIVRSFLSIGKVRSFDRDEFKLPSIIPMGNRNDTLFRMACSMQSQGYADSAIFASVRETNKNNCIEPLDDDEVETIVKSALEYKKGELKIITRRDLEQRDPHITQVLDKDGEPTGKPAQTVANAEEAITYDPELFGRICFNEIACSPWVYGNLPWKQHKGWREWTNSDDSNLWSYIEAKYGLKNNTQIMAGLNNVISKHTENPIKQMLEFALENYDGNKHVENLLPQFVGADKSPYNTAVIHLFMLGAVSRIYSPGCKFDYMLVLVGEQGKYKSSFLRWLAINDDWFNDNFNSLDGDKAFEKLRGMWIVELAELQATKRTKDVEAIKAFITSRVDTYRAPYARRTEHHPRMCVLAGTSNPVDFLTDRTGNRRFLPVTCGVHEIPNPHNNPQAVHFEFMQAWGEIMTEYMQAKQTGKPIKLALDKSIEKQAMDAQVAYLEDDPDVGVIQEWLNKCGYNRVCMGMIWKEALKMEYVKPDRKEINHVHDIMRNCITGWEYKGKQMIDEVHGIQRAYDRINKIVDEVPFS